MINGTGPRGISIHAPNTVSKVNVGIKIKLAFITVIKCRGIEDISILTQRNQNPNVNGLSGRYNQPLLIQPLPIKTKLTEKPGDALFNQIIQMDYFAFLATLNLCSKIKYIRKMLRNKHFDRCRNRRIRRRY